MTGIGPLLLLLLFSSAGRGALMPSWPTPSAPPPPEPPPPMPAIGPAAVRKRVRPKARPAVMRPKARPAVMRTPDGPVISPDAARSAVTPGVTPKIPPAALDRGVTVSDAQRIILAIEKLPKGAPKSARKAFTDGLYGPKTRAAWEYLAKQRGLDPLFARIDGRHTTVAVRTWESLRKEAADRGTVVGMWIP